MIAVDGVTKSFGAFRALDDVSLEIPQGSLTALLGPQRLGQVDAAAGDRGARGARQRARRDRGRRRHRAAGRSAAASASSSSTTLRSST